MTPRQRELLTFIVHYQRASDGVSPSFEEMREGVGLKSKSGIHRLLSALQQRGHIHRDRRLVRSITIIDHGANDAGDVDRMRMALRTIARHAHNPACVERIAREALGEA